MSDFIISRKNSVQRPSLYCVWIRAHEGENAPLISVWIDPSMSMFEPKSKVQETEFSATSAEEQGAVLREDNS